MNITTRRFPRTLAEAFPDERASAGTHHRRHWLRHEMPVYVGLVAFLALVLFGLPLLAHLIARAS